MSLPAAEKPLPLPQPPSGWHAAAPRPTQSPADHIQGSLVDKHGVPDVPLPAGDPLASGPAGAHRSWPCPGGP